jgi:hypothetical protein
LNWKQSRFLDKLFTAHFSFRFDSYRQCLCFSVEALTRETQGTKTWGGKRPREGNNWRGEGGKKKGGRRSRREPSGLPPRSTLYPPKTGARGGFYEWKKNQGKSSPKEWSSPRCSQAPLDLRMGLNNMLQQWTQRSLHHALWCLSIPVRLVLTIQSSCSKLIC